MFHFILQLLSVLGIWLQTVTEATFAVDVLLVVLVVVQGQLGVTGFALEATLMPILRDGLDLFSSIDGL